jgi:hypothetical protein
LRTVPAFGIETKPTIRIEKNMRMNPLIHGLCWILLLGLPVAAHAQRQTTLTPEQQLLQVMHSIESQNLYAWVDTLASGMRPQN